MADLISILISGLIMGSIYALLAGGLTLIWGVMRIVNLAHGEFLMLGCFATYYMSSHLGGIPLLAVPIIIPVFFVIGALLYWLVIKRVVNAPELMSLLLAFGISIFIINICVLVWSGEMRIVKYVTGSYSLGDIFISRPRAIAGIAAVIISLGMYVFLQRTRTGSAIRAVAIDKEIAEQCGINSNRIYLIVFGMGTALAAVAGNLASTIFAFNPLIGQQFMLKAFAVTVFGGMGNFLGALIAGLIIGEIEQLVAYYFDSQISAAVAFVAIIATLLFKPTGILGKR
jgi:branched-chain amino acid transport system permease protein